MVSRCPDLCEPQDPLSFDPFTAAVVRRCWPRCQADRVSCRRARCSRWKDRKKKVWPRSFGYLFVTTRTPETFAF